MTFNLKKIAVIGLGYVGLPLAVAFGGIRSVVGFDINEDRINNLKAGCDATLEVSTKELADARQLSFTSCVTDIAEAKIYIVTVPTPVDVNKYPNLKPLIKASEMLGGLLKQGDIVIYESTVYPGATEDDCIPVLESVSGLTFNVDFFVGYSPERINPGDKKHRLTTIKKVTAGSTPEIADFIDELYGSIITAGTYKAESIRVAEASKVIENTQRDLNIALVNELAIIFNKMGIDTSAVLRAAGTKWNFLPFKPGLVGGHCIGVDPYYLTHKAEEIGYHPQVILAGRRINDGMGSYVAGQLVKAMLNRNIKVNKSRVLVLGFAFKENCTDFRNTRVIDVVNELYEYGIKVNIYDPWVNRDEAKLAYGVNLIRNPDFGCYDGIVLAVAHDEFINNGIESIQMFGKPRHIIYDLKSVLPLNNNTLRL